MTELPTKRSVTFADCAIARSTCRGSEFAVSRAIAMLRSANAPAHTISWRKMARVRTTQKSM